MTRPLQCKHTKCRSLRSRLRSDPPYHKWIFLVLGTWSIVEADKMLKYVQDQMKDEKPRHCTRVTTEPGPRTYQMLLRLPSNAAKLNLTEKLLPGEKGALFNTEYSCATPLMDCIDAFEGNARVWIGILRDSPFVIGSPRLLDEFESYINGTLGVEQQDESHLEDMVAQTPSSSSTYT